MFLVFEVFCLRNKGQHNVYIPTQHSQNQVENKEGSKDDQTDKVDPRQLEAHCVIHLNRNTNSEILDMVH